MKLGAILNEDIKKIANGLPMTVLHTDRGEITTVDLARLCIELQKGVNNFADELADAVEAAADRFEKHIGSL